MLLHIHPDNPQQRNIDTVVDCLRKGGVIIYPTDTIYVICCDLSHLSDYAKSVDTPVFRLLKAALPGPYTFILQASKEVPKQLKTKKDTVGIRIPDNKICHQIVKQLGHPLMSV